MEILFIDESRPPTTNDKLTDFNQSFVLSGLIIPEDNWHFLDSSVRRLSAQYHIQGEIKWRFFSPQNKDNNNSLSHLQQIQKNDFRTKLLKLLGGSSQLGIVSVICNLKDAYKLSHIQTPTHVYDYCYQKLVEYFQDYLQEKERVTLNKQYGIIVCDHRGKQDDTHLRSIHHNIPGVCASHILESVFFVPSQNSLGIQLVDLVAGAIYRLVSAHDDNFYRHILPVVRQNIFIPFEPKKDDELGIPKPA